MSDDDSVVEERKAENDPDTEMEEDFVSVGKDGTISSDEAQLLDTEVQISSQKMEKKKEKCGNKPKVKIKTLTIDGQLVYFCKICDKIFTRRKDKLNHELAHSGETMLSCSECGKEYLHESSLASHMRTHDVDPLFMCDLCPKMFAQSHHLKTHILSHSEPTNFTCKTCYKEFATAVDLNHHNRSMISQEMSQFWCKMCKVYFCRTHGPVGRSRIHAHCCSACNELFYTHKKLKIHMKKFAHFSQDKPDYIEPLAEEELYPDKVPESIKKCQSAKENSILKQSFQNLPKENKRAADEDLENIVPRKKFKLSPRKVFLEDELSSTSIQDSPAERKHETDSELRSPSKYRKGKPYCKKCNRSFKDSFDLDRHRSAVHAEISVDIPTKHGSSVMLFTCKICNAGFATQEDLERHGFKHSGERMHVCPMCAEEFPQALQLTRHLKTHMGDHPYRCSQCGKSFRLKIQLIQHVRLHIVQDANSCDKCPSKFNTRAELQDHTLQAHRDVFRCHLCGKVFNHKARLVTHLRLRHRTTEPEYPAQGLTNMGLKRSLSVQEADRLSYSNIKTEPLGSECESEQSFCSSFTRDSEKSDVFKFSSDESFSFKTTMAKERIRLRRRWRRTQCKLLDQISSQHVLVKEEGKECTGAVSSQSADVKVECDEDEAGDEAKSQEVLDMMIELNVVQSEGDNLVTVYADVRHKIPNKPGVPLLPVGTNTALLLDTEEKSTHSSLGNNCDKFADLSAKLTGHGFQDMVEMQRDNCFQGDVRNDHVTCGNTVMFEFDPEEFGVTEDDLPILLPMGDSSQSQQAEEVEPSLKSEEGSNRSPSYPSVSSAAVSCSTSSGLARLQEVFQNSSKYLPLSTSNNSKVPSQTEQTKSGKSNVGQSLGTDIKTQSCSLDNIKTSKGGLREARDTKTEFQESVQNHQVSEGSSQPMFLKPVIKNEHISSEKSKKVRQSHHRKNCQAPMKITSTNKSFSVSVVGKHDSHQLHNPGTAARDVSAFLSPSSSTSFVSPHSGLVSCINLSSLPLSQSTSAFSAPVTYTSISIMTSTSRTGSGVGIGAMEQQPGLTSGYGGCRPAPLQPSPVPPHQPSAASSTMAIQPASIFDTNNPLLRDMNMMDLVRANTPAPMHSTPQLPPIATPQPLPTATQQHSPIATPQPPPIATPQPLPIATPQHPPIATPQPPPIANPQPPPIATPQPPPIAIPLPAAEPVPILQPNIPLASVMAHPGNNSVPSIPDALSTSIHMPLPQNPAQILPPTFALPPAPGVTIPPYAAVDKPLDIQLMQHPSSMSNYSNNSHLLGPGVQGLPSLSAQHQAGFIHQSLQNPLPATPGISPAFIPSLQPQQLQQQQLASRLPDVSSSMRLNCMLGSGNMGASDAASALSAHMRSMQESALKESLFLNAAQSNGFQQNLGGELVGGINQFLPQNMGSLSGMGHASGSLYMGASGAMAHSSGSFNIGAGGVVGPLNFPSAPGGPLIDLGGQIPAMLPSQMVNLLSGDSASLIPGTIGFSGGLGQQAQLAPNLTNPALMLPGGPTSLPANLMGVLGPPGPSGYMSHFPGFPHL